MVHIVMYTTGLCPYCFSAKRLLAAKGVVAEEIRVDREPHLREEMIAKSGRNTVPQIWIGGRHVGGFTDLRALDRAGELDKLLGA